MIWQKNLKENKKSDNLIKSHKELQLSYYFNNNVKENKLKMNFIDKIIKYKQISQHYKCVKNKTKSLFSIKLCREFGEPIFKYHI